MTGPRTAERLPEPVLKLQKKLNALPGDALRRRQVVICADTPGCVLNFFSKKWKAYQVNSTSWFWNEVEATITIKLEAHTLRRDRDRRRLPSVMWEERSYTLNRIPPGHCKFLTKALRRHICSAAA